MAMKRFCTVYSLWALAAIGAFVALGFWDPATGAANDNHGFWSLLSSPDSEEMRVPTIFRAAFAILIGGLVHALIVIVWSWMPGVPSDCGSIEQARSSDSFSRKAGE
ncbi:MAG: hypothetical protein EXR98_16805 [Gemmataceae bacterium]|nr:hypothetical protein [Gemmataceae bacterium]